eukprot:COSAG02_NODE_4068_length_5835_cov_3.637029_5_plen_55_part_00
MMMTRCSFPKRLSIFENNTYFTDNARTKPATLETVPLPLDFLSAFFVLIKTSLN